MLTGIGNDQYVILRIGRGGYGDLEKRNSEEDWIVLGSSTKMAWISGICKPVLVEFDEWTVFSAKKVNRLYPLTFLIFQFSIVYYLLPYLNWFIIPLARSTIFPTPSSGRFPFLNSARTFGSLFSISSRNWASNSLTRRTGTSRSRPCVPR